MGHARLETKGHTRREVFRLAGAAAAGFGVWSLSRGAWAAGLPTPRANLKKWTGGRFPKAPVTARARVLGANDRLNLGFIGVGGMGYTHVRDSVDEKVAPPNINSLAVCDPYLPRIERARAHLLDKQGTSISVQGDADYRRVLENKDVDAVIIATPEHWHCQIAVHALEAGKHVYVQKPMARYLDEAFALYDAAKKHPDLKVQIGSQSTTDPKYHRAREVIRSGKLGPLATFQTSYTRNSLDGEWNYKIEDTAGPDNLDWDMWLGSAAKRPWNEESRARYFRYRKYRDYSAGILGDLMPHRIHPAMMAADIKDFPLRVSAIGTRAISTDREVSDSIQVMAEFPGGFTFVFVGSTVNEQGLQEMVRGHKATMYTGGNRLNVAIERPFAEELEGGEIDVPDAGESNAKHVKNWVECIRDGKTPNCDIELAIRAQTVVSLAEISEVTGKTVAFDAKKRTWKPA